MPSPITSKHLTFLLTEVLASEVPAILRKFILKETTSVATILKLFLQPGHVYVISFCPTRNWQEGEKPATDFTFITRSAKSIFSKRLTTSLSSVLSFLSLEHVWLKIIWLESSYNPECFSDRMTMPKQGLAAEYC